MTRNFLFLCLLLCLGTVAPALAEGGVSALVKTAPLSRRTLAIRVTGYGTVLPESGATVNLNFPTAGIVDRLRVLPGQRVKRGQTLLEVTTDPAGTLAFQKAESAVALARSELVRSKKLLAQQLGTRAQVDSAAKALRDAEAALAAQRALGRGRRQDRLRAPFDGLVVSIAVAQGDRFAAGANLVQMSRTTHLRAELGVEPEDSRRLRPGMAVRLVSVFDPTHGVEGRIRQVGAQIDPRTQLVDVTVRFPGASFLPGTQLRGDIAAVRRRTLAVPRQAVLRDARGAYLFQVVRGRARRIAVTTGIEDGGWIEVHGAGLLQAPVVILGNYELKDGMAVRESGP